MKKNLKGFTLIEMAVVLLVIGILAGIVLRNIGGQTAIARDTRRQGDLRNVSNYLATYMAKFGYFPNSTDWNSLETELKNSAVTDRLPNDPQGKSGQFGYNYFPCSDAGQISNENPPNHFVLRAQLEQLPSQAPRLYESSANAVPNTWTCLGGASCDPESRYYCVIQ